jgi:3-oxoacyl-[acyl-carrier-protein] synthase II
LESGLNPRVVITGTGVAGSCGAGKEPLAAVLEAAAPVLTAVDRSAGYHLGGSATLAALVPAESLAPWLPAAAARRMSTPSRYAVSAARMALADAALESPEPTAAVVLSTAFGPTAFTEKLVKTIDAEGPEAASPFLFTECVANAPAAQVAIACAARGPNVTLVQREAGPLLAVARAAGEVASGRAARALAGAVDEMPPIAHALLDRFRALARPSASAPEAARPFDRRRDGFVAAEGASVLVLEREDAAVARGATVRVRVRAAGSAFDPTASRVGWGRGEEALARALCRGLGRAGLRPQDVDLVVSGASGARGGDRLEGRTLCRAWDGATLPPVLAPKGVVGEYGGGFLAAAVLAAEGRGLGPAAGFDEPDSEVGITPHRGAPLSPPRRVLVTSFAAGGAFAWLVLERT